MNVIKISEFVFYGFWCCCGFLFVNVILNFLYFWSSYFIEVWFKFFIWGRLCEIVYFLGIDNS